MIKIVLIMKNNSQLEIQLKRGSRVVDHGDLTISQNLDTLLITTLDNLLVKNKIDKLSFKSLEIQGEIGFEAVSSMILGAVKIGLEI